MPCYVYILRCSDGTYYIGHAHDLRLRLQYHNQGRGPTFTAARRPVAIVYSETHLSAEDAVKRETQLTRWTRAKKEALIAGNRAKLHALARRVR